VLDFTLNWVTNNFKYMRLMMLAALMISAAEIKLDDKAGRMINW
jgi:hypothetical protein